MKKILSALVTLTTFICTGVLLQGCLKDHCTHTYRMYTPVYKTTAEVRANIKSNQPRAMVNPGKLFIKGNYIFLNEIDRGVHIIDNTDPVSPKNVAFIDIPGNMDLAVKGNTLYADLYIDLVTLDISDPLHAAVKKITDNAFPFRRYTSGFVADNSKIVVDWQYRDTTVSEDCEGSYGTWGCPNCGVVSNVLSSATADASKSLFGTGGSMARFCIVNNSLFTVSDQDLNVYSIASADNPVFSKKVSMGWGIETLYPFQDKLFIGSTGGMFIYNISSPENPAKLGQFTHARACDPVIADDNHAFVTLRGGNTRCATTNNLLDVLDISSITTPVLLKSYPMTNPHGLSKDGSILFICDGRDGLKVYDAANVNDLKLQQHITGFESYDVIAINKLAIVVTKNDLRQYDYSDVKNIRLLSSMQWNY